MPDAPISTTPTLGLGQWAEGANPGFAALNENWALIDAAMLTQGATNPETYPVGGLFLNTNDLAIYRNDGTELVPVWVNILPVGTITEGVILKDGSVAMEADLDLGGFKAKGMANGLESDEGVNRGQLDAAIAALESGVVGSYSYFLARNTGDLTGSSPILFEADENDATTTEPEMHDEDTNPERFVAPQDGIYLFGARIKVTGAGGAGLTWKVNGTEAPASVWPLFLHDVGEDTTFITDEIRIPLSAGDYVTLHVYGLVSEPMTVEADSTVSGLLLMANAAGSGDLKADGSIPMTDPFDNGGNTNGNAADGVLADDLATVGQMAAADAILQTAIDGLTAPVAVELKAPEVEVTSGTFAFGAATGELTASRLDFTLNALSRVVMEAEGTATPNFINQSDAQMGIRVQAMVAGSPSGSPADYWGTALSLGPYGYGMIAPITCKKRVTLAAGDWRISIICRKPNGVPNSSGLYTTATVPARIGATYLEQS